MSASRESGKPERENTTPPAEPHCRVLLVDEATVVPRGEELRVWFVELGQGWVKACDHPRAIDPETETEDGPPPGTVWRRATELSVPVGTRVMRRVTAPHIVRLDPLAYLERGKPGIERRVVESLYRVSGNYRLETTQRAPESKR